MNSSQPPGLGSLRRPVFSPPVFRYTSLDPALTVWEAVCSHRSRSSFNILLKLSATEVLPLTAPARVVIVSKASDTNAASLTN